MAEWVRLCAKDETPSPGSVIETEARGMALCLANVGGELSALDNWCPHRQGPLGQGWVEDGYVLCPWHAWAFDVRSGLVQPPEEGRVEVFAVRVQGDEIEVNLP